VKKAIIVRQSAAAKGMSALWRRRAWLAGLIALPFVARGLTTDRLDESSSVVIRQGWVLSKDD
jgi:hypothetical protein